MIDWDDKFIEEMKKFNINPKLFSRFKDDILLALRALARGTIIKGDKLIIDEDKKIEDEGKTSAIVTMEIVKEIAERVDPEIKFTIDTPCNHPDGYLPVLDTKMRVNIEETNRIDFQFYEKPTKNPKLILADSALDSASKRTILTQECLRRLRNTKIQLGEEIRNQHLNNFMVKLKNSGYNEEYRVQILNSALKAFEQMIF